MVDQAGISLLRDQEALRRGTQDLLTPKPSALWKMREAIGREKNCAECEDEIPQARIDALRYPVRCRDCEEHVEVHGGN